jgi:hypothetical protein
MTLVLLLVTTPAVRGEEDDLETTVSLMAKIGASSQPSFSPDGRRVAFRKNPNRIKSTVSIVRWFEKYLKS